MVTDREAYVADRLRKLFTMALAAAGTWFLFRVLYRMAVGTQRLMDIELFGFIAVTIIAYLWIRATRRMPRSSVRSGDDVPVVRDGSDDSAV